MEVHATFNATFLIVPRVTHSPWPMALPREKVLGALFDTVSLDGAFSGNTSRLVAVQELRTALGPDKFAARGELEKHVETLVTFGGGVISRVEGGHLRINFGVIRDLAQALAVERVVVLQHGEECARLFRLVKARGYLEQKQVTTWRKLLSHAPAHCRCHGHLPFLATHSSPLRTTFQQPLLDHLPAWLVLPAFFLFTITGEGSSANGRFQGHESQSKRAAESRLPLAPGSSEAGELPLLAFEIVDVMLDPAPWTWPALDAHLACTLMSHIFFLNLGLQVHNF